MDGVLVTTEINNCVHQWVVYVTVNNETTTHYFVSQEEAKAFADTAIASMP
jgi:hypothetical protein